MNFEKLTRKIHYDRNLRIWVHIVFWFAQFLVNWYMTNISFNTFNRFDQFVLFQQSLAGILSLVLLYYPLAYFVLPKFNSGKYFAGTFWLVVLVFIYGGIDASTEEAIIGHCTSCMQQLKNSQTGYYQFLQGSWANRVMGKVLSFGQVFGLIYAISIPLAIKISLGAFRQQFSSIKLAKENVELEFNFLRSQINPHFLFNTLNNIYGLILTGTPERSAALVARLSSLLRYILYESNQQTMPLAGEINLIKDYIELEKVRLNFTKVKFDVHVDESNYEIAPLLLMPLIENAFKFCGDDSAAYIHIFLDVLNGRMRFTIENSVDVKRKVNKEGGIGLNNLTKRLELYYPGRYTYEANVNIDGYSTYLTLDLS